MDRYTFFLTDGMQKNNFYFDLFPAIKIVISDPKLELP